MKKIIFSILLLSFFSSALFALDCQFDPILIQTTKNINSCDQVQPLASTMTTALQLVSASLKTPTSIFIVASPTDATSYYDGEKLYLPLIYRRTIEGGNIFATPVWLHELGHQIFDFNYSKHNKKYRAILKAKRPDPFNNMIRPYTELFADAFAVLLLGDPSAMSNFFVQAGLPKEWEMDYQNYLLTFSGRNFADPRNEINQWSQTNDPYDLLSPVRYAIGQKMQMGYDRISLLAALYVVLQEEIDALSKLEIFPSYRAQNERLLIRLQKI